MVDLTPKSMRAAQTGIRGLTEKKGQKAGREWIWEAWVMAMNEIQHIVFLCEILNIINYHNKISAKCGKGLKTYYKTIQ